MTKLTEEENVSFGSFEGTLETVNIHGSPRRFWIYPPLGPQKVRCEFLPGTYDQVKEALGHFVRVTGLKIFSAASPYPVRIKVKELVVVSHEERVSLSALKGIAPNATAETSTVDFIRQIRDEWESLRSSGCNYGFQPP